MNIVYLGDIGTKFRCTIKDQDGDVVPLVGLTTKIITFIRPDTTTFNVNASFETDGTDGKVYYVTAANDINRLGIWRFRGVVTYGNGQTFKSDIHTFKVKS
jgi:hypothetical protein